MEQELKPLQPGELTATAEAVPPYRRTPRCTAAIACKAMIILVAAQAGAGAPRPTRLGKKGGLASARR